MTPRIPAGRPCDSVGAVCEDGLVCKAGSAGTAAAAAGITCRYYVQPCARCDNAETLCWSGYSCGVGGTCQANRCSA